MIETWLGQLGLDQYAPAFLAADVDLEVLPDLNDADLQSLGVTLGHRKRMLRAIEELRARPEPQTGRSSALAEQPKPQLEQRQVSVLFGDLVGSTALSERFDPEDLHVILTAYRDCCVELATRFGGSVTNSQGDGVLVRFGYPQAHEDDAERAIACGLELVSAVRTLLPRPGAALSMRIGIATGSVVVGDRVSATQEELTTGDTPNLAARLQNVVEPGHVAVDQLTRQLAGATFRYQDLGPHALKGFAAPVGVWQVTGTGRADTRFAIRHLGRQTEMIGREHELGLIQQRWAETIEGEGRVMLLSGEAGIGKSRLVAAFCETLSREVHTPVWQCSPYHVNTALFPALDQIARAANITPDDAPREKLFKLEQLAPAMVPVLADLLGITTEGRHKVLSDDPAERKQRSIEGMLDQLQRSGEQGPVCLVVEDMHWIDPTSLELLELEIDLIQSLPVMIIATVRPESVPAWSRWGHVTTMSLTRLNRRDSATVAAVAAGGSRLSRDQLHAIVERADGVPLFLEELAASLAGISGEPLDPELAAKSPIPSSLQSTLIERLDRLASAKEVAQIASVIGREVMGELLAAVAGIEGAALDRILDPLVAANIMHRRGIGPALIYVFKHSLLQDAAYSSLLRARRKELHGRVSTVLEQRFPIRCEQEPEVLAYHLTEAGHVERAFHYWMQAAKQAIARSANREAVAHTARALQVLATLPPSAERDRRETAALTARLMPANNVFGFSSDVVENITQRLRQIFRDTDNTPGLYMTFIGEFVLRLTRAGIQDAIAVASSMAKIAKENGDALPYYHAVRNLALGHFLAGQIDAMGSNLAIHRQGREVSISRSDNDFSEVTGYAVFRMYEALFLWMRGDGGASEQAHAIALDAANGSGRVNITIVVRLFGAVLASFQGNMVQLEQHATYLKEVGEKESMPNYAQAGRAFHAVTLLAKQSSDVGCDMLSDALQSLQRIKTMFLRPLFLCWLAVGKAETQGIEHGLAALDEAQAHGKQTGELVFASLIECTRGRLLSQFGLSNRAERAFRDGLEIARKQGILPMQLRAGAALTELLIGGGRAEEALALLGPICQLFDGLPLTAEFERAQALMMDGCQRT